MLSTLVFADEDPNLELDPNTNTVSSDSSDLEVMERATELIAAEETVDQLEDEFALASNYGEEPFIADPEDDDGYITGNEHLEDNAPIVDHVEDWRQDHPEDPGVDD
jgi:hypothetical protein